MTTIGLILDAGSIPAASTILKKDKKDLTMNNRYVILKNTKKSQDTNKPILEYQQNNGN